MEENIPASGQNDKEQDPDLHHCRCQGFISTSKTKQFFQGSLSTLLTPIELTLNSTHFHLFCYQIKTAYKVPGEYLVFQLCVQDFLFLRFHIVIFAHYSTLSFLDPDLSPNIFAILSGFAESPDSVSMKSVFSVINKNVEQDRVL